MKTAEATTTFVVVVDTTRHKRERKKPNWSLYLVPTTASRTKKKKTGKNFVQIKISAKMKQVAATTFLLFTSLLLESANGHCNVQFRQKFCPEDDDCLACNIGPKCRVPGYRRPP